MSADIPDYMKKERGIEVILLRIQQKDRRIKRLREALSVIADPKTESRWGIEHSHIAKRALRYDDDVSGGVEHESEGAAT